MATIQKGEELGVFECIGIVLGVSKNENNDHKKERFAIFSLQDEDYGGDPVRDIRFEGDYPRLIELLQPFAAQTPDEKGGYAVNMKQLRDSDVAQDPMIRRCLRVKGGQVLPYRLKKGECYANDVNGNPVMSKDKTKVTKTQINVFCQIRNIITNDDGSVVISYTNGYDLNDRGEQLERRFFKHAVNDVIPNVKPTASSDDAAPNVKPTASSDDAAPF